MANMNAYMLFETLKIKRRLKSEFYKMTLLVCKQNLRPVIDNVCVVLV